jgi:hypothetical protein
MTKSAVFAVALVLGLTGMANAQSFTINFSGLGLGDNAAIPDNNGPGATDYQLDYTNALYWSNTSTFWYGAPGQVEMSYASGSATEWRVNIIADPGFEIFFDGYTVARQDNSDDQVNISVDGTTNDSLNQATTFTGPTDSFTRTYTGATRPRGTSVALFWTDGAGNDVAIDSFSFTVQAIPEPTVLAPMALAGMGMFLRRRRA